MNIFISHCSKDAEEVKALTKILAESNPDLNIFFSSDPEKGIAGGQGIMSQINSTLSECECFVPIITENYVRSLYCMYELSVVAYLRQQKKIDIIPIASNAQIYNRVSTVLQQFDIRYIDASDKGASIILRQSLSWINADFLSELDGVLHRISALDKSDKPYIGMPESTYRNILEYCQNYGVRTIKNTVLESAVLVQKVSCAKEVIILATTGAGIIKTLSQEALPKAVANGCQVSVIVPNQHSQFCEDVGMIERPDDAEDNFARLDQEYTATMGYLKETLTKAGEICGGDPDGVINCYCCHNLLRQTILLVKAQDDTVWSWLSVTLPPQRTADGTPSVESEGTLTEGQFVNSIWKHCNSIMTVSKIRNSWFQMTLEHKGNFYLEQDQAKEYWMEKFKNAEQFMRERDDKYGAVLIEVAAQHPLKRRSLPGEEFSKRLDLAVQIYENLQEEDYEVKIYVPGSRHRFANIDDKVSLSDAGAKYLADKGIPEEAILGEEENQRYKGEDGVYNSADECYVSSQIFKNGGYDRLISVCSPNQIMRKTLFYMEFGVLGECYSIPTGNMFHNPVNELFNSINTVLYKDHSWQNPEGEAFRKSREERMPKDNID